MLAGASVRRELEGGRTAALAATAGAVLGGGGPGPAVRLAASIGLRRGFGAPFVEASLLAGGQGAPGAFAAFGLYAGVRFGVEGHHGHDPDRR